MSDSYDTGTLTDEVWDKLDGNAESVYSVVMATVEVLKTWGFLHTMLEDE